MHGPLNSRETEMLRKLPAISRAREHRLYAMDGSRWVDCWADGGRLLEGHRPGGLGKRIKNEVDRGLYAPYPGRWEGRLEKTLLRAFPGYAGVRIYRSAESALDALGLDSGMVTDPLDMPPDSGVDSERSPGGTPDALWGRFLLPGHPAANRLLPILPCSGFGEVQPVLFRDGHEPDRPSEIISPIVLAALTRSVLPLEEPEARKLPFAAESSDIWERRGPYMLYRGAESEYKALFDTMFEKHILISPSPNRPSVFPADPAVKEARMILQGGAAS